MGYWGRIHIDKLIHLDAFAGACDIETNYQTVIKNLKPHGVVIATNSINHFAIAKFCINRDISVYVEKPIATEGYQIDQYDRMLEKHDVRFQAGFQMIYDPIIQAHAKNGTKFMSMFRLSGRYRNESVIQTLMIHDIAIANYIYGGKPSVGEAWGNLSEVNVNLKYMTTRNQDNKVIQANDRFAVLHSRYDIPKFRQISFLGKSGKLRAQSFDNHERPDLLAKSLEDWMDAIENKEDSNLVNYKFARDVQKTVFNIEKKLGLRK